jgi:hypothetical protein
MNLFSICRWLRRLSVALASADNLPGLEIGHRRSGARAIIGRQLCDLGRGRKSSIELGFAGDKKRTDVPDGQRLAICNVINAADRPTEMVGNRLRAGQQIFAKGSSGRGHLGTHTLKPAEAD